MKNKNLIHLLSLFTACIPLIYIAAMWNSIPTRVPIHYNLEMVPDHYGSKTELLAIAGLMSAVALLVYFLLRNIHKLDPKRITSTKSNVFDKLAFGLLIFITALSTLLVVSASSENSGLMERMMLPLVGLMFAFLGNYMYSVKPNYFVGIRTPWTLSNDENWRITHRFGGTLWFIGGLLITLLTLFTSPGIGHIIFIAVILPMVIVPIIYSFMLIKKGIAITQ